MKVWLVLAVLIGTPIFVLSLLDVTTGTHLTSGDAWVGIIVPPAMALFGLILPRIGLLLAQGSERFVLEHIQHTLGTRVDRPELDTA